jgi:poly(A) polymerase
VPDFTIKGGDLIKLGLPVGPVVAQTLQSIERRWITEDFPPAARLRLMADQAVADAMLAAKKA